MDLTIIIPVYNTACDELARCLDSLRLPEDIAYEVILVDDGSEEQSARFCREYARRGAGFHYVRQHNQGASAARNHGLALARGRYVLFVDSDDQLLGCHFTKADLETDAQLLLFDFEEMEWNRRRLRRAFNRNNRVFLDRKEVIAAACGNRLNAVWAKLYRRCWLEEQGISFDRTMVSAEDAVFVLQAVSAAERICYVPRPLYRYYHHYQNENNRLARFPEQVVENSITLFEKRRELLSRPDISDLFLPDELRSLKTRVRERLAEDLFLAMASLLRMGQTEPGVSRRIQELGKQLYRDQGRKFSPKAQWKCRLLAKNRRGAMLGLACLREIYIRFRR